jgi:hypothetical protein
VRLAFFFPLRLFSASAGQFAPHFIRPRAGCYLYRFNPRALEAVVAEQGSGAGGEDSHSVSYRLLVVIRSACPVAADVGGDSFQNRFCGARQMHDQFDVNQAIDLPGLIDVAWQAVEDDKILGADFPLGYESIEESLSDVESVLLQKGSRSQDAYDEVDVVSGELIDVVFSRGQAAQPIAKIKVETR